MKSTDNEMKITTSEYDTYELHLWGNEDGLQELSDLIENLQDQQELVQASVVMKAIGIAPESDDDDVWWETCGLMEGDGYFSLVIYEYTKCAFTTNRLSRVICELKNVSDIEPGIGWQLFRNRTVPSDG